MDNLSLFRRLQYGYLGRLYALAFWATTHRLLGISLAALLKWLLLLFLLYAWATRMPAWMLAILLAANLWLHLSFWHARRTNYNRFVSVDTPLPPSAEVEPLPANHRVTTRATGLFCVTSRESAVLLQSAEYWQVPLGDHIVMVEERPGKYLYQFFNASTLQEVRQGWLIFGHHPLATLAITFLSAWGPAYTNFQIYESGNGVGPPPKKQTIYLTFENGSRRRAVWHTIVADARRARA